MAWNLLDTSEKLVKKSAAEVAQVLAIRRAALRLFHDASEGCDDSYGGLGEAGCEQIKYYATTDWRSSEITAEVFWSDLLRWCISAENYGLAFGVEAEILSGAQIGHDRDLINKILIDLGSEYTTARQAWAATSLIWATETCSRAAQTVVDSRAPERHDTRRNSAAAVTRGGCPVAAGARPSRHQAVRHRVSSASPSAGRYLQVFDSALSLDGVIDPPLRRRQIRGGRCPASLRRARPARTSRSGQ